MEVLKQPQYLPYQLEEQVAILFLAINGYLMSVKVEKISLFIKNYIEYLKENKTELMKTISETGAVSIDQEGELRSAIETFKGSYKP
jgi:F-type H+-transporting ATPase subunit alpha